MEDSGAGREAKRLSDDAFSRGEQRSPHQKSTTSPNHSSTSPLSTQSILMGGTYSHPPPPSQPPPPPPSQARRVAAKGRPQQQQQMMSQGDPPRGHPQEKSLESSSQGVRKEEGQSTKTAKLLGSDIHHGHQVAGRNVPVPSPESHDDRRRRSSSPDHDKWHTSSDTYLLAHVSDQVERDGGSLSQSHSPQMQHRHHDNQLQASNSDTKLLAAGPSSSSRARQLGSGGGEGLGVETRVLVNSKAEVRGHRSGGKSDYIFTRVVNRSEQQAGHPAAGVGSQQQAGHPATGVGSQQQAGHPAAGVGSQQQVGHPAAGVGSQQQKAGQLSSQSSQPNSNLYSQPNQPSQSGQPNQHNHSSSQSGQPTQPSPHPNSYSRSDGALTPDEDAEGPGDQTKSSQTKLPSPENSSRSPEGPPSRDGVATNPSSSSPTMASASSSTEELSKYHEDQEDNTAPVAMRPMAAAPLNHAHQRGGQPPPPQTHLNQHHVRPVYVSQGAVVAVRGQDGLPLPQTRTAPSQQYEKVIFGADPQLSYHRPQVPKQSHDYPSAQDEHYHLYSGGSTHFSEPFGGSQGLQAPPPPAGGHKSQSRLVRIDPAQMGTKTKVTIAHDAAIKGDTATLRFLLTSHEIDPICADECGSSLIHKAAQHGHTAILRMLCSDLPPAYMQVADSNFDTPAMLAIQGGYVDCLQYLVQEGGVPLEVKDAGGETLVHHAAYHGQQRCLELLLKLLKTVQKTDQPAEILDDSGVTPAHFAAQRGHLECLQLLTNYGYNVTLPDREGQKPSDWADAMGQAICTRYLIMVETSWALSLEVARLGDQVHILRKQNEQLKEVLKFQEQEHRVAMGKLQQEHDLKVSKMKEQYIDLTTSLLKDIGQNTKPTSSDLKDTTRLQQQQPMHGKKGDAPSQGTKGKPPPGLEGAAKRKPSRPAPVVERPSQAQPREPRDGEAVELALDEVDYRATTPQEVLRRQLTSVEQRMNASREIRKKQSVMATLACAPQSPTVRLPEDGKTTDRAPNKTQHHAAEQQERRPNKVKFAANVTEINSSERQLSKQQPSSSSSSSSPLHTSQAQSTKDSSSDATAANGSDSRFHPSEPSHSKKS